MTRYVLLFFMLCLAAPSTVAAGLNDRVRTFLDVHQSGTLSSGAEVLNFGTDSEPKFVVLSDIKANIGSSDRLVDDLVPGALDIGMASGVFYGPSAWSECAFAGDWTKGERVREYVCQDGEGPIEDTLCSEKGLTPKDPIVEACAMPYDGSGLAGLAATVRDSGTYPVKFAPSGFAVEAVTLPAGSISGSVGSGATDGATLLVHVPGDARVPAGTTLTTAVRRKGMVLYVDGDLYVDGTISMTDRGARGEGVDLLAAPGVSISATGGAGGARRIYSGTASYAGNPGDNASGLSSGGGGSGGIYSYKCQTIGGSGSAGTSWSGGSGGGGAGATYTNRTGGNAGGNGGAGGGGSAYSKYSTDCASFGGGGAGNERGSNARSLSKGYTSATVGGGTGGLLVVAVKGRLVVSSTGSIVSEGSSGGVGTGWCLFKGDGGSSGGGVVVILHGGGYDNAGTVSVAGGSGGKGGKGGSGGTFVGSL